MLAVEISQHKSRSTHACHSPAETELHVEKEAIGLAIRGRSTSECERWQAGGEDGVPRGPRSLRSTKLAPNHRALKPSLKPAFTLP